MIDRTKVPMDWIAGLSAEAKESFLSILFNNTTLLERFLLILSNMEKSLDRAEISDEHFKTPEWAYRQAAYLGERKALTRVKSLFSFIDPKGSK